MGFFLAVFGAVLAVISGIVKKNRGSDEKYQKIIADFYNDVTNNLEPGERIEAYCGYVPCAAVTNKRLLIGDKNGIKTVAFSQIRKVQGMNFSGNKTNDPGQMLVFEIRADKKYVLGNHSDGFAQVVEAISRHVAGV
jgi:hypothetical protein